MKGRIVRGWFWVDLVLFFLVLFLFVFLDEGFRISVFFGLVLVIYVGCWFVVGMIWRWGYLLGWVFGIVLSEFFEEIYWLIKCFERMVNNFLFFLVNSNLCESCENFFFCFFLEGLVFFIEVFESCCMLIVFRILGISRI